MDMQKRLRRGAHLSVSWSGVRNPGHSETGVVLTVGVSCQARKGMSGAGDGTRTRDILFGKWGGLSGVLRAWVGERKGHGHGVLTRALWTAESQAM